MKALRKTPAPKATPKAAPPVREIPQLGRFTITELEPRCCRWPTTEYPTLYCGAIRADDKHPYCARHNELAYPPRGTAAAARIAREQDDAAERMGASA